MKTIFGAFVLSLTFIGQAHAAGERSYLFECVRTNMSETGDNHNSVVNRAARELEKAVEASATRNEKYHKVVNVSGPSIDRANGTVLCVTITYEKK